MDHNKFERMSEVQRFREIGGVLDFMYVDYISEHNLHAIRLAAYLFAYWTIERELQFRREVLHKTQQGRRVTYQFRSEPPQTVEQVTALEFAGDYYDWDTGAPRVRKGAEVLGQGYAHAFANPPYRLRAHSDEIVSLFQAISRLTFGGMSKDLEVYEMSGEWFTYFDSGREWWGSRLWIVTNHREQKTCVIGASSTD